MIRTTRVVALVALAFAATAPLQAALFTITLTNGTSFESRFRPRDAQYDAQKVVFQDETGNLIALAKSEIDSIESDVGAKGFGHMLDDTTMAFGWAPNDKGESRPDDAIATTEESDTPTEPIYNVNENPSVPLFYSFSGGGDAAATSTPPAPTPAPPPAAEPPPGE